jgi:alkylation response protein AidB-like acyl-CoA dehydrogenase
VLHFPLALSADGVTRGSDWDTHGMRGTGSSTLTIKDAFVPDEAIAMKRPRGPFHPAFHVISTLALPIITSVYTGVAERAAEIAIEKAKARRDDPNVQYLTGELRTELFVLRSLWNAHVDNANEYDVKPDFEISARSAEAKTAISRAAIVVVEKAMELAGGAAYFRKTGIEQLRRDVAASQYHPLQAKRQHLFSGRGTLGLDLD